MSPKMPASVTPIASTTATQPSGIASIAARVEIGDAQEAGVARSSRAGTKRSVNARPTMRGCSGRNGLAPRIQTLRRPFLSSTVVRVAVVTPSQRGENLGIGRHDMFPGSAGQISASLGRAEHGPGRRARAAGETAPRSAHNPNGKVSSSPSLSGWRPGSGVTAFVSSNQT